MRNLSNRWLRASVLVISMALASCGVLLARSQSSESMEQATHTRIGERMPAFSVHELSGSTFSMAQERGKVVLVNFWATWCGPCQVEMPKLEKDIWDKYKSNPKFAMVAIAREQTKDVVAKFQQHHPYTFPLAYDPDRSVYKKFADIGIPRTYLVGKDGKIVFQSGGYDMSAGLAPLDKAIQKALAAK